MRNAALIIALATLGCTQPVDSYGRTQGEGQAYGTFTCGLTGQPCCVGGAGAACMPGLSCAGGTCLPGTSDGGQSIVSCGQLSEACCVLADGSQRCVDPALACDGASLTCVPASADELGGDTFAGSTCTTRGGTCYDRREKSCLGATRTASEGYRCAGDSNFVCCASGGLSSGGLSSTTVTSECSRRGGICYGSGDTCSGTTRNASQGYACPDSKVCCASGSVSVAGDDGPGSYSTGANGCERLYGSGAKCQHDSNSCGGSYVSGLCPGGNRIRCCPRGGSGRQTEDTPGATSGDVRSCTVGGETGVCKRNPNYPSRPANSSACAGDWHVGACPGLANDIQCCIPRE